MELSKIKKASREFEQEEGWKEKNEERESIYGDFLFKVGLMVLNLGVPEVKMRNYEYCQFSVNYANICEKLRLFKIKYRRKNLANLVEQFLYYKIQTMDDLWHLLDNK